MSYGQYFQNAFNTEGKTGYIRAHYDVTGFYQGGTPNNNVLGRLRNAIAQGINKQVLLPKAIIIIIENDLLNVFRHYKPGISHLCGRSIEWLGNQLHRMITSHKERLASKSRKFKYPTLLWVLLPTHNQWSEINEARSKFNTCLKNTSSLFREMQTMDIADWDKEDPTLVTRGKFNATGLTSFWKGLDRSFEIWDREQMSTKIKPTVTGKPSCGYNNNRRASANLNHYREESADSSRFKWKADSTRFRLPKPPT